MSEPPAMSSVVIGVVILAAGRSTRMGKPKLLLPWGETSVLGHVIQQWQVLEARQISVVCADGDEGLRRELERLGFSPEDRIINPDPDQGMFSSIRSAAAWPGWRPELTHWAIVLGDQPHLREQTLREVVRFASARSTEVCQPAYHGHGRHPVLLPCGVFRQLAASKAITLKEFLSAQPCRPTLCELDDAGLDLDIDRPGDYEEALRYAAISPQNEH